MVDVEKNVREAIQIMTNKKLGSVLVQKDKEIVGIVEESDIIKNILGKDLNPYMVQVEAVMSLCIVIDQELTAKDASDMMSHNKVRHLAVSDGKGIVGVLSMADLIKPVYTQQTVWT